MATWQDILASEDWKGLQPEQKRTVANNYFKTYIEPAPEFGGLKPEEQQKVRGNFAASYLGETVNLTDLLYYQRPVKPNDEPDVLSGAGHITADFMNSVPGSAAKSLERGVFDLAKLPFTAVQVPEAVWNQTSEGPMSANQVQRQITGMEPNPAPSLLSEVAQSGRDMNQWLTDTANKLAPPTPVSTGPTDPYRFANPMWIANEAPQASAQTIGSVVATMMGQPELSTLMYGLGEGEGAYQEIYQKALLATGGNEALAHRMAQDAMLKTGTANAIIGGSGIGQVAEGMVKPSAGQFAKSVATETLGEGVEGEMPSFVADSPTLPYQFDPQNFATNSFLGMISAGMLEGPSMLSSGQQVQQKPSLPGLVSQADQVVFSLAAEVKKNKPELWAAFEKEVTPRVANGPLTAELRDRFIAFAAAHSVPAASAQETEKPRIRVDAPIVDANSFQNLNTVTPSQTLYQEGGDNNGQGQQEEGSAQDAYAAQGNGQDAQGQEKEGMLNSKPRVRIQPTMMKVQPKAPAQILFEQIRKAAPHIPEEQARGFAFGVFDEFATSKAAEEGISKEEWYLKNLAGVTNKQPGKGLSQEGEAPTFYSQLSKTVEERMGKALLPSQVKALIGGVYEEWRKVKDEEGNVIKDERGRPIKEKFLEWSSATDVKQDEVEETGIFDWLDELPQDQKVTKEAVQQWLDGNGVQVVEHELSDDANGPDSVKGLNAKMLEKEDEYRTFKRELITKYGSYSGPEVPREEYLKLIAISVEVENLENAIKERRKTIKPPRHTQYTLEGPREGDVEFVMTSPQAEEWNASDSMHYNDLEVPTPGKASKDQAMREFNSFIDSLRQKYLQPGDPDSKIADKMNAEEDAEYNRLFQQRKEAVSNAPRVGRTVAWIRGNWRTDATGAKVFHIEEVQSQRHQKGHEEGYQLTEKQKDALKAERKQLGDRYYAHGFDPESEEGKAVGKRLAEITDQLQKFNAVGNAPFKNSDKWMMLVFKKALRYAVESGAEKITFTTGEQQAKRWNKTTENIKAVEYFRDPTGNGTNLVVNLYGANDELINTIDLEHEENLTAYVGSQLTDKIKNNEGVDKTKGNGRQVKRLEYPNGLTIGGEGMKNIYDQIFRKEIDKYIRKFDKQAKVEWEGAALVGSQISNKYSIFHDADTDTYGVVDDDGDFMTENETEAEANASLKRMVGEKSHKVHSLTLTPALRDAVAGKSQALYQTKKGAISQDSIGRAVFHLFEKADFSTLVHESFHFFRRQLSAEEQKILEAWAGVKDGVWTREAEEKVARAGEHYIRTGKAPAPRLKRMYEKFKQWMTAIYQTLRGSDLKFRFNPEVKAIFDKHLGDNELKTKAMMERVISAGVLTWEQMNTIEQFVSEVRQVVSKGQRKTINFVVSDEELDRRVSARLQENGLEAEKRKILDRAKTGRLTIDEYGEEQLIGLKVVSNSCILALKTGDKEEIEQNIDLSNAFGDEGTWIARNLRARGGTSLMTQAEKAKAFIAMQLFRFDKKTRFALGQTKEAASKSGDWSEYNKQYKLAKQKHINFLQNMKKGLLASGIDLLNMTDEQLSDPNVLYQIAYETEKAKTNVWDALLELKLGMLMASKTMHVVNIGTTALHALHDLTFRRWAEALVNLAWRDPRLASFGELLPMYKSLFFGRPEIKNQAGQVVHPARPGALWYGWHYMKETFMQERPVFEDEVLGRGQTSQHVGTYRHYINQHLIGKYERKTYTDFQVVDSKTGNVVKEYTDQQQADQYAQRQQAKENKKANPIANRFTVKQNNETHGVLPPGKYLEFAKGFLDTSGKVVRLSPRIASTFDALFGSIYARMQVTAEANRLADTYVKEWQRLQKNPQASRTVGPNTMKLVSALAAQCNNDAKELHRQIVDTMIDNYGSDAWINAMEEETRVTFHRPPGRLLKAFLSWRGQVPFMDHFVLFVNISSQLFKTGFQMSPLNLPQVVGVQIPSAIYKRAVKAEGWEGASREMTRQVAEQIVGVGALAIMWGLLGLFAPSDDGPPVITGSSDLMPVGGNNANAGKDTYLNRTQGKAYSINLGGYSFDYRNIQPFSSLLSSTADLYNDMFNAPDQVSWEERATNLYRHFMANFTNNTFLRTLFEMSNAMQTGDNMGKFMLNNVLQFVPTVVRQERAAADPYVKDYGVWGQGEDFDVKQAEIMQYKTGVADLDTLRPQVDLFGRELKTAQLDPTFEQGSFASIVGAFIKHELNQMNLLKPQALPAANSVENQVWQLVQNYNRSYPDKKWFPAEPSKYLKLGSTVSGKPVASPLTREEYNELCVRRGEVLRGLLLKQLREGKLSVQQPIEAKEIAILQSDIRVADTVARSEVLKKRVQAEPSKWMEPLQSYYEKTRQEIESQKKLVNSLQNMKTVR